jgi:GNAT superfamily N-acetyltransferase
MLYFKTATPLDAQNLAQLVNSAYRGDSSKLGWTTEADLLDGQRTDAKNLTALINEPENQIEMAIDSDSHSLVGCVYLKKENSHTLYFGMLTVAPKLQTKGTGKALIKHIEEFAKKNHYNFIRISVIQFRTELIKFYERRGFVSTGQFEDFPEDDPQFGIPKINGLKLMEFIKTL